MTLAVGKLGADLDYLPDGETGARRNWVISMIESFRDHPDLQLTKPGDWSDYDRTPRFGVRKGRRLYGAAIDLGIDTAALESFPTFCEVTEGLSGTHGRPSFQVGIPGDIDLAMFTLGPSGPVRHRRPFTEALAASMHKVRAGIGADVVFQIELPVELVLIARAPRMARSGLARAMARDVASLALGAPTGSRFGVHLCLGDMNHRALGRMADTGPIVTLANAIVAAWPQSQRLEYMHVPLAAADDPPSGEGAFYQPLARLELGSARFIAGYAHEDQPIEEQLRIRDSIEEAVGHPTDVSTSCGLGRREAGAAGAAMDRIKALIEA